MIYFGFIRKPLYIGVYLAITGTAVIGACAGVHYISAFQTHKKPRVVLFFGVIAVGIIQVP
jgi:hypothetical protein